LAGKLDVVAVVSGRPVRFLLDSFGYPFDPGPHPVLCGLYGLQRWTIEHGSSDDPRAEAFRQEVEEAARRCEDEAANFDVERKGMSVVLHWRRFPAGESHARAVAGAVASSLGLVLREGKMCVELLPDLPVDKGRVLEELVAGVGPLERIWVLGDDLGDLPAFDAASRSRSGGGQVEVVKVAVGGPEAPAELLEAADLVLAGPEEVADYLAGLLPGTFEAAST
jgi:trehalose 6-phosphate phosphatase